MKYRTLWVGLLGLWVAGAAAIELNTEAMKKMQEEGHKRLEEHQALRTFKLAGGQCLQAAGNPGKAGVKLVSRKCNDKANNQKWQLDNKGRLASYGDTCVGLAGSDKEGNKENNKANKEAAANAVLQPCDGSKDQKWSLDGANRLRNPQGLCLEAQGGSIKAAKCGDSAQQKWS